MNTDIERFLKIIMPSNRKQNLFFIACNRHAWEYLEEKEKDDVLRAEKNEYKPANLWGAWAVAWIIGDRTGDPNLVYLERDWQYKLLLHMFYNHKWLVEEVTKR